MGLQYYSPRFIDVSGSGETKHIMTLTEAELKSLKELHAAYGIHVASIGSPIGKVKLIDKDDGTHNRFVPFAEYLTKDVQTAIDRATFLARFGRKVQVGAFAGRAILQFARRGA